MSANQTAVNQAVTKCARFFKTLLHLSEKQVNQNQQPAATVAEVRQLVGGVLYGRYSPEEFQVRLQKALHSQAQQNLLPFLQQTLPPLRTAMLNGELTIEGIGTSEEYWAEVEAENSAALAKNVAVKPEDLGSEQEMDSQSQQQIRPHQYTTVAGGGTTSTHYIQGPLLPHNFPYTPVDAQTMLNQIRQMYPECNDIEDEVLFILVNAAEDKMRTLLGRSCQMADHRLDPLHLNSYYRQLDNPRKQLHSVEAVERRVFERRETLEREALIRISKSKGKDKDTIEHVKQIQKAEKEAALNREANEAAIAALGGIRSTRRLHPSAQQQPVGSRLTVQTHKQRITRITNRDVSLALRKDAYCLSNDIYYKLCYSDESKSFN